MRLDILGDDSEGFFVAWGIIGGGHGGVDGVGHKGILP
jgi:hypothetical protein